MEYFNAFLTWAMQACYGLCHNYGTAILLFTLFSRLALFPLSVLVQKNSIRMIKMQPELNFIKARYYGDKDRIAQEQTLVFQKEKYHPLLTVIPLIIQIVLLIGLVDVIRAGMEQPGTEMEFFGLQLQLIPAEEGGILGLIPVVSAISAWILCAAQNAGNVLQSEQSRLNKYGMTLFSVALSLYLGWYVPAGVAVYWVSANLMAVVQLYVLNALMNPRHSIDYAQLEKSRQELLKMEGSGRKDGLERFRRNPYGRREKADYKRFFSVLNKHLVFYSESSGFYKYYQGIIEYLLDHTNLTIHYITSDPKDVIFELEKKNRQIRAYYIGEKRLITLMMKMDADMVVMTMPDLDNYHIKRSYVRKDIEYVYVPHGMGSNNLTLRKAAIDHFDTVFCSGKHQKEETQKTELAYGLPKKKILECGYPLLDRMRNDYGEAEKQGHGSHILIAPSWQKDNIIDLCITGLLDILKNTGYRIIVRPHPQHVRHEPDKMEWLKQKYQNDTCIEIQTGFSSNDTVFTAAMVITDWSDIAYEYAFTTYRPVLFIDTPAKIMNPEYQKIDTEPFNMWMRYQIGKVLEPENIKFAAEYVTDMMAAPENFYDSIYAMAHEYVYHPGNSSKIGAEYIVGELQKKMKKRKNIA